MAGAGPASMLQDVAPGSLVVVRDEECLVTQVAQTRDGMLLTVHGLSELGGGDHRPVLRAPRRDRSVRSAPDPAPST